MPPRCGRASITPQLAPAARGATTRNARVQCATAASPLAWRRLHHRIRRHTGVWSLIEHQQQAPKTTLNSYLYEFEKHWLENGVPKRTTVWAARHAVGHIARLPAPALPNGTRRGMSGAGHALTPHSTCSAPAMLSPETLRKGSDRSRQRLQTHCRRTVGPSLPPDNNRFTLLYNPQLATRELRIPADVLPSCAVQTNSPHPVIGVSSGAHHTQEMSALIAML